MTKPDPDANKSTQQKFNEWVGRGLESIKRADLKKQIEKDQKEVEEFREKIKKTPKEFLFQLAMSLNNLACSYSGLGNKDDALKSVLEAVEICGNLVKEDPVKYEYLFGGLLHNLGNRLHESGDQKEAVIRIQEAIKIFRLVEKNTPYKAQTDLFHALEDSGKWLRELGRKEDSDKALQEAENIRKMLVNRKILPPKRGPMPDYRAAITRALTEDPPKPVTDNFVDIAIVWKYDRDDKKQTAIKVVVATEDEQEELEKKYPEPDYGVEIASTSHPESFIGNEIKEGETYELGYDWFDTDLD